MVDEFKFETDWQPDRVSLTRFAQTSILLLTALMLLLNGFIIWALLSGEPGHQDIIDQFEADRNQLTFVACLLAIPDDELTARAVEACQVRP